MSIEPIKNEILRFLSDPEQEVVCLKGRWGVGKTYSWNKYLKEAQAADRIAFEQYSYVSLFGINSLEEVKFSIFENVVSSSDIDLTTDQSSLRRNWARTKRLTKKSVGFFQQLPIITRFIGGTGPFWFALVSKCTICIDDVERRGDKLSVKDLMGLISTLKEQKRCKILLILNDEALEKDKEDFNLYYEKVVDVSLTFSPTPSECTSIALSKDSSVNRQLARDCESLGISNIRIIKKIERAVYKVEGMLSDLGEQVLQQATHSLALFGWSLYDPKSAPTVPYLTNRRPGQYFGSHTSVSEQDAQWNALLDLYGFTNIDEFDQVLLEGMQSGYFDPLLIAPKARELNEKIRALKVNDSFSRAWKLVYESFDNNAAQVIQNICDSFRDGVSHLSMLDLNGTVVLLKALGRPELARELIQLYTDARSHQPGVFDLAEFPFRSSVTDPDVIAALNEKEKSTLTDRDPAEILLGVGRGRGWSDKDINILASLKVEDYYRLFKQARGEDFRLLLKASLQLQKTIVSSPSYVETSSSIKTALLRIGQESEINQFRVKAYGVDASEAEDAT